MIRVFSKCYVIPVLFLILTYLMNTLKKKKLHSKLSRIKNKLLTKQKNINLILFDHLSPHQSQPTHQIHNCTLISLVSKRNKLKKFLKFFLNVLIWFVLKLHSFRLK